MKRVWTIGAVVAAALWVGGVGAPAVGAASIGEEAAQAVGRSPGQRTVSIAGRRVMVSVAAWRNFGMFRDPMSRTQATVYLATADGGSLPGITSVKVSFTRGSSRWTPVLATLPTDVASYRYYVAQNGPVWPEGATLTANVEIKTGGSVTKFTMPVVVTTVWTLQPTAG